MYGASAAGDHSIIWLALAGLAGSQCRQGGRALARAGCALAAESALVNGLVKLAFRRKRPAGSHPSPLPLRTPRTSSFPSGHASAAFFAAALLPDAFRASKRRCITASGRASAQRRYPDLVTPPIYLTAAVVAASRVYVRMHHASDVLVGASLGAALGWVARRAFPVVTPIALRPQATP